MEEKELLNRKSWLKANGFYKDPFLPEAAQADTDSYLPTCFFDRKEMDYLIGDFTKPGYRLIFSKKGGGKSGIRNRIQWEYEKIGKPKVLVLHYIKHDYPPNEATIYDHVDRIVSLAEDTLESTFRLKRRFRKVKALIKKTPKSAIKTLVTTCQNLGFSGLYLLVDNIGYENLEKIAPLALFATRGFVIKFFLDENLLFIAQSIPAFLDLPQYIIKWTDEEYIEILNQRLIECLDSEIIFGSQGPGIYHLCESHIFKEVENCFINIGRLGGGPALMWKFGNLLLDKHIGGGRVAAELIGHNAFAAARLELFDGILKSRVSIGDYRDGETNSKTRETAKIKPKAKIFLHCIKEDREMVTRLLYHALKSENYYPWLEYNDITPGEKRDLAISNAIKTADLFIPCFSVQSVNERGEFQVYLGKAIKRSEEIPNNEIFIIPFRLDNCELPDQVQSLQHIDWFEGDYLAKLYLALKHVTRSRKINKK